MIGRFKVVVRDSRKEVATYSTRTEAAAFVAGAHFGGAVTGLEVVDTTTPSEQLRDALRGGAPYPELVKAAEALLEHMDE